MYLPGILVYEKKVINVGIYICLHVLKINSLNPQAVKFDKIEKRT